MTGQEKKSQKGYISLICGEAPTEAMYIKICVVGDVLDVHYLDNVLCHCRGYHEQDSIICITEMNVSRLLAQFGINQP